MHAAQDSMKLWQERTLPPTACSKLWTVSLRCFRNYRAQTQVQMLQDFPVIASVASASQGFVITKVTHLGAALSYDQKGRKLSLPALTFHFVAGSDRRREVVLNSARVFAHAKLLEIFPILPDSQAALQLSHASASKLNQRVAHFLLHLDPWLCVPPRQVQRHKEQPQSSSSQRSQAAVASLVYTVIGRRGHSQNDQAAVRLHADSRVMQQQVSAGPALTLAVQRLLEYAMHVMSCVGASSNKEKKSHSEGVFTAELRTALQVVLNLIGLVRTSVSSLKQYPSTPCLHASMDCLTQTL
jgi:hypothetical protein